MKVCLILVAVAASCVAQAPAGWRPSGRLLLLPARLEEQTTITTNSTKSGEKESARILDSGEYYVLLKDGRLQMVKYTTAALKEESAADESKARQTQQFSDSATTGSSAQPKTLKPAYRQPKEHKSTKYAKPSVSTGPSQQASSLNFARIPLGHVQFPVPVSQYAEAKSVNAVPQKDEHASHAVNKKEDSEKPSDYETNLQYRNVKPISAPIYSYNQPPLIRILKK